MHETGCSGLVPGMTLRDGIGREVGGRFRMGDTCTPMCDSCQLGSKITADGDCSYEIKRCLLLGRKVMTNLHSILKSRDYIAYKGPSSQGYGFSSGHVWM